MQNAMRVRDAFGYLTEHELEMLYSLSIGKEIIVNIGAGAGTSGLAFREGAGNQAEIYTIDDSPGGALGGLKGEKVAFLDSGLKLPHQILSDSARAGAVWESGEIDLLFIDANHQTVGIEGDIKNWLGHVKQGGLILFHDYGDNNWPAVKEAVDRLASEYLYSVIDVIDCLAVAEKL